MRIISGLNKGKKLIMPNNKTTRPLKDMAKESIFNMKINMFRVSQNIENGLFGHIF